MRRGKYRVVFERDPSGAWIARVPSVRGCHTYGRTLDQARRRIREALSLWAEDAENAELVEDVRLPARVRQAIGRTQSARRDAQRGREKAQKEMVKAARMLVDEVGLGLRDAGELLNVSHQRVQQLTRAPRASARARSRAPRP
jgi:predicted RNase H-like HicB family nuclease